jgi:hypothetical protein
VLCRVLRRVEVEQLVVGHVRRRAVAGAPFDQALATALHLLGELGQGDLEVGEPAVDVVVGLGAQAVGLGRGLAFERSGAFTGGLDDLGLLHQPVVLGLPCRDQLLGRAAALLDDGLAVVEQQVGVVQLLRQQVRAARRGR